MAAKIPKSNFQPSLKQLLTNSKDELFLRYASAKDFNGLTKNSLGPILAVNINLPEDVKIILSTKSCFEKPDFRSFLRITDGTMLARFDTWDVHRKIMNPFFNTIAIRSLIPIFNDKSKKLIENVSKMEGQGDFNIFYSMTAMALETILKVMELEEDILNQTPDIRDSYIKSMEG